MLAVARVLSPTEVILGLVPRIEHAASAGASGEVDGRDKPDHDKCLWCVAEFLKRAG